MRRLKVMTDEAADHATSAGRGGDPGAADSLRAQRPRSMRAPLIVGAAALAGVGLGLIAVIAGSFLIGLATESILAPTLLAKVAGGLAGGGVGMAKGVNDTHRRSSTGGGEC